jgi:hypothetical protein
MTIVTPAQYDREHDAGHNISREMARRLAIDRQLRIRTVIYSGVDDARDRHCGAPIHNSEW